MRQTPMANYRSIYVVALSGLIGTFAFGAGSAQAQGMGDFRTGFPAAKTLSGYVKPGPNGNGVADFYHRLGHWDAATLQARPAPLTYDPTGGAVVHNSRNRVEGEVAAMERAKVKRQLALQGGALKRLFSRPDVTHVVTKTRLPTTANTMVDVRFEITRSGRFTVTIPAGQWFDSKSMVVRGPHRRFLPSASPVTVSGQINPQTGMFQAQQNGTNVVGHIDGSGRVVLRQLDAIGNNHHLRRLTKNKSVTNRIRGSSYTSKTLYAEHALGVPRPFVPTPTPVATTATASKKAARRATSPPWSGALFTATVMGHSVIAGKAPNAELAFPGTKNTSGRQDLELKVALRRGKKGVEVRARIPVLAAARHLSYTNATSVTVRGKVKGGKFIASTANGAYALMGSVGSSKRGPTLTIDAIAMYGAAQKVQHKMRTSFQLLGKKAQKFSSPRRLHRPTTKR